MRALAVAVACGLAAFAAAQNSMDAMVSAMRSQLSRIATRTPANTICSGTPTKTSTCLVRAFQSTGQFRTSRRDPSTVTQVRARLA